MIIAIVISYLLSFGLLLVMAAMRINLERQIDGKANRRRPRKKKAQSQGELELKDK